MPSVYYSSVLDHPADEVWRMIRDFNHYPSYIEGVTESAIEDNKRGDEVGAIRRFNYGGTWLRQRLEAHSDAERFFTYSGMEPFEYPVQAAATVPSPITYEGTLRITPVVDGDRTFAEWSVAFEGVPEEAPHWTELFSGLIPDWMGSLRRALDRRNSKPGNPASHR